MKMKGIIGDRTALGASQPLIYPIKTELYLVKKAVGEMLDVGNSPTAAPCERLLRGIGKIPRGPRR